MSVAKSDTFDKLFRKNTSAPRITHNINAKIIKYGLEEAGYEVKKTGKSASISKTIITNKKDVTDENLKKIKETLGVGSVSTNKSSTSLVDVTVVIGKDF